MESIVNFFRTYPEMAIFLTIGLGFWIGSLKYKNFTLGTVTSVLLVGVLVGQMDIPISGPLKSVFFLLFLFAIGYSVGPQFVHSLRSSGIKQVMFAVVVCIVCLGVTIGIAKVLGYNAGMAAGLFAGAQTISAVIGVGTDTINSLSVPGADKSHWIDMIPVCYAVTYIFGTIGSAYILGTIGPRMLGGIDKVKAMTRSLEQSMSTTSSSDDPSQMSANTPIVFRAYKVGDQWFENGRSIKEIEQKIASMDRRIFVERVRTSFGIVSDINPSLMVHIGDEVVLSGRREAIVQDESWIGEEVFDAELLSFPMTNVSVTISKKGSRRFRTVGDLRNLPFMYGVMVKDIKRGSTSIPVLDATELMAGDLLDLVGLESQIKQAADKIGYLDRPSNKTDLIFVGLGILLGGIIGALTIKAGGIPISLSTSGGALISGLIFGWLRTKHPTFGRIPQPSIWILNNLGLNMFIAVIGISSGPTFIAGIKEAGVTLFLAGIVATTLPLLIAIWLGDKVFKFHPAVNLGCCAGARTTTAALGAVQESLGSNIPAMGYTVTYAVGNTLLILMGVAMVLLSI